MMLYIIPYLFYSCLSLVGIFLQAEVFSFFTIFGAKPDLLLIIAIMSGIHTGRANGAVTGAIVGFWADLLIGGSFGIHILTYAAMGYIFGAVGQKLNFKSYLGYFFAVFAAGVISGFVFLFTFGLTGVSMNFGQSIVGIVIPYTFYNCLLITLCFPVIFIYRRFRGIKIGYIDLFGGGIALVTNNDKVNMNSMQKRKNKNSSSRKSYNKRTVEKHKEINKNKKKKLTRSQHSDQKEDTQVRSSDNIKRNVKKKNSRNRKHD